MWLRWPTARLVVAICAVAPLLAPEVWSGFRLAQSDPILSVISAAEQPLSVRSPGGIWAMALALAWWSLAYWRRRVVPWEILLVVVGGAAALVRVGNAWLDALALVAPLASQLTIANRRPAVLIGVGVFSLMVAAVTLWTARPPALPDGAVQIAAASAARGTILADWNWAGELQRRVGGDRQVLAAGGLASQSTDFWLDYLRIAEGHELWADALRQLHVDLVVLDSSDEQRQAAALVRASTDWRVLYDASGALVAERIGP